jgi:hypothetical protein
MTGVGVFLLGSLLIALGIAWAVGRLLAGLVAVPVTWAIVTAAALALLAALRLGGG